MLATRRTRVMSTTSTTGAFCDTKAPGSTARLATKPLTGRGDDGIGERNLQLLEARLRLGVLSAREVELRDGGQIPAVGVVERLLREELPFEKIARAFGVGFGQLELGFALTDGRQRDLLSGFGLLDLFEELVILDLRDALAHGSRDRPASR